MWREAKSSCYPMHCHEMLERYVRRGHSIQMGEAMGFSWGRGCLLWGLVIFLLVACGGEASDDLPSKEVVAPPGYWDECGWGAYCKEELLCENVGFSIGICTMRCEKDSDCPGEDTCMDEETGKFCGHIFEDNPFL